jgi:HprK-related kinase A
MFEWGLNWCISSRAHRYLIIHAAVVEKNGRAAILPAPPGSGKSTLCAALVGRGGWRLLSDELTLLRLDDGLIEPVPRPVSLKNGAIDVIGRYLPSPVFSRAVTDTVKGTVAHMKAPAASILRAHETAAPAWLIFPRYEAGVATLLEPVPRARAFMRVADNAFNYSVLGGRGFTALGRMIDEVDSHALSYSVLDEALDLFDRLAPPR